MLIQPHFLPLPLLGTWPAPGACGARVLTTAPLLSQVRGGQSLNAHFVPPSTEGPFIERELLSDCVLDFFFLILVHLFPTPSNLASYVRKCFQAHFWSPQGFREKDQVYDSVIVSDEWKLCLIMPLNGPEVSLNLHRLHLLSLCDFPAKSTGDNYMRALLCPCR